MEFAGELNLLVDLNDKDGALTWTLLQQTYTNLVDKATFGLVVRGEVGAASPDTGASLVVVDDYSLTSTGCPQVGAPESGRNRFCSVKETQSLLKVRWYFTKRN